MVAARCINQTKFLSLAFAGRTFTLRQPGTVGCQRGWGGGGRGWGGAGGGVRRLLLHCRCYSSPASSHGHVAAAWVNWEDFLGRSPLFLPACCQLLLYGGILHPVETTVTLLSKVEEGCVTPLLISIYLPLLHIKVVDISLYSLLFNLWLCDVGG